MISPTMLSLWSIAVKQTVTINFRRIFIAKVNISYIFFLLYNFKLYTYTYTQITDTQWWHKLKISEKLDQCGRQYMLQPYLRIWEWEWIFAVQWRLFPLWVSVHFGKNFITQLHKILKKSIKCTCHKGAKNDP